MLEAYDRYISDVMKQIWSPKNKYEIWLIIEKAVVRYLWEHQMVPHSSYDDLFSIHITGTLMSEIQNAEATLKHDVLAFVETIARRISSTSSSVFHRGLTSSDLVDTGNAVMLTKAIDLILSELFKLIDEITKLIDKYGDLEQVGRTHGMHTEPIKLSHKFNVWLDEMFRNKERLELVREHISVGKLSGPVGTRTGDLTMAMEQEILNTLGIRVETSATQVVQRDRYAFMFAVFGVIAGSIERIATEVRHLSRTEVSEFSEGFSAGQKGSSSMPHKKNPITAENLCGLARVIRGMVIVGMENQNLWHERDISHSSAERFGLPISTGILEAMIRRTRLLLANMTVDKYAMERNRGITRGHNMSGPLLYKLQCAGMSRNEAYNLVMTIARDGSELPFREKLARSNVIKQYLSARDLFEVFVKCD